MTRTITSAEDLDSVVGQPLDPGDWLEIDQQRVNTFADATGDHQWIHVNAERAAAGPYGATIAHGFLTLSLIPVLGQSALSLDFGSAKINYGLNKVRFMNPVKVGSRIRTRAQIIEVKPGGTGTQVVTRYTVEIEGTERPACVAEQITLILP